MSLPIRSALELGLIPVQNLVAEVMTSDPVTPTGGRLIYRSDTGEVKFGTGAAWVTWYRTSVRLDQITAPTASVGLNSQKITGLADGTAATDAATKGQVDALAQGIKWKQSVRVATTANGALATAYENGDAVDGVTLATGDRILLKNQTAGAENGIYTVNASGAPTRATDADVASELVAATVLVEQGTSNQDTIWNQTADAITLGTTALVWVQVGAGTLPTAGAGLTLTGSILDVVAADGSITVAADSITVGLVPVAKGGTNATTAAAARLSLGAASTFAVNITGDGTATDFTVTHSLGTKDVIVQVWEVTTDQEVLVEKVRTSTSVVTIKFAAAPANAKVYRVVVMALPV